MRASEFLKESSEKSIGPHEGRELELMLAGQKPAALVSTTEKLKPFKPHIKNGNVVIASKYTGLRGWPIYFITLPGEEWRGPELLKTYLQIRKAQHGSLETKPYHARMGELLGYPKEDIEYFLRTRFRPVSESTESKTIMYHVTPAKNVKWIMKGGLQPSIGSASSSYGETEERIYLFPNKVDAEDAVMNWLGDQYESDILALLAVDVSGIDLKKDVDWEYYANTAIDPSRIKVLSMDF